MSGDRIISRAWILLSIDDGGCATKPDEGAKRSTPASVAGAKPRISLEMLPLGESSSSCCGGEGCC